MGPGQGGKKSMSKVDKKGLSKGDKIISTKGIKVPVYVG